MTEKRQPKSIDVTLGRALALLFSLALVLFCAAPSWAQAAPPAAKTSAKLAAAATASAQHAKSNGGTHEGIIVHGWWTIDVKNPDGKVVTHREFENSLARATVLGTFLAGTAAPGAWSVQLAANGGLIRIDPPNATKEDT
jgi:hypothetical protein